jgi:prepilin-type N-terminal cleavage/methylation domain-containing protein/prepilin-type processing-associated H-X9-DG protein
MKKAFTLIELLVVISILGVLTMLLLPASRKLLNKSDQAVALNNMRQVGLAFHLFAADNDFRLPGRVQANGNKWPRMLATYLGWKSEDWSDPAQRDTLKVYAAPGQKSFLTDPTLLPLDNNRNRTSFIMNGYNDVGAFDDPSVDIRINRLPSASEVILLGTPQPNSTHYYMDMLEGKHGNHIDVLNLSAYGDGSNYVFADGSARFITQQDYEQPRDINGIHYNRFGDYLWLVDKAFEVPYKN